MTNFLFKELLSFFKRLVPSGISLINRHLFILDGHGSHVTLKAIEHAQTFGLDMIILPSHTSHAMHPLVVTSFKLFKIALKKKRCYNGQ